METFLIIYVTENFEIVKYLVMTSDKNEIKILKSMDGNYMLNGDNSNLYKQIEEIPKKYEVFDKINLDMHIDNVIITGE